MFTADELLAAQSVMRRMPVGDQVVEAILDLVRACRPGEAEGRDLAGSLSWGPGPRAAQALMLTVRARALLDGRLVPLGRRCGRDGATRAGAPHGAVLCGPRARRNPVGLIDRTITRSPET